MRPTDELADDIVPNNYLGKGRKLTVSRGSTFSCASTGCLASGDG